MTDWSTILGWRLLRGSHAFPGADGGACVNEAAVVAAGFSYREVMSVEDLPPCFCRVISQFALTLNDAMDDETRQRLVPFVVRFAGAADPERAGARAAALALAAGRAFAPAALRAAGFGAAAARCAAAADLEQGRTALRRAREALMAGALERVTARRRTGVEAHRMAKTVVRDALMALEPIAAAAREGAAPRAEELRASAERAAQAAGGARDWDAALAALETALAIGRRAEPTETAAAAAARAASEPARADAEV